jgi:hypothetical protein
MAGVAGCGGGDDDDDGGGHYDFNGTWAADSTVVQSNVPGVPVGLSGTDVIRITQSGTNIIVVVDDIAPLNGTCDPAAGTFTATGTDGPITLQMNGVKVDDDTMSGELTMTSGAGFTKFTYTANLTSRSRAVSSAAAGGAVAAALRSLR